MEFSPGKQRVSLFDAENAFAIQVEVRADLRRVENLTQRWKIWVAYEHERLKFVQVIL